MIFIRWIFLGLGLVSLGLAGLGHLGAPWIESVYSRAWSPYVSSLLAHLTGWLPFSLGEILIYGGILSALVAFIVWIVSFFNKGSHFWITLGDGLLTGGAVAGLVVFLFMTLWGLNYSRLSLFQIMNWPRPLVTAQVLDQLCRSSLTIAAKARDELTSNQSSPLPQICTWNELAERTKTLYKNLPPTLSFLEKNFPPPKSLLLSPLISYLGISGIYLPWTAEANVNTHTPFFRLPAVAAHEMAHQRGIAREDEANYLAYLVCIRSKDPLFQYSGALLAFSYTLNALHEADNELFKQIWKEIPQGIRKDFEEERAYFEARKGPIRDIAQGANDLYLKANRQAGVVSYNMVVELLAAERAQ